MSLFSEVVILNPTGNSSFHDIILIELHHEQTFFLHMQKQRRRPAVRYLHFVFAT